MENLLLYIAKASGVLFLFYGVYILFLRKETFFSSNRWFLLGGIITSVIIPYITITKYKTVEPQPLYFTDATATNTTPITQESINWLEILSIIYITVIVVLSIRFILQLISLYKLIRAGESKKDTNITLVKTTKDISPFSFFNYVVYNPITYTTTELEAIITHERAHVIKKHTVDVLVANIATIIFWANPIVWLYKKTVQQNLEFQADAIATKNQESITVYQKTLLKVSGNQYCAVLANNFYNSLIKKRIIMLHTKKSKTNNVWKYTLVIPMLIAFVFAFNTKVVAQKKEVKKIHIETNELKYVITKNTTDKELKELKNEVKNEGATFNYSGLKRNADGEITAIKVDFKDKDNSASSTIKGDTTIKPIFFGSSTDGGIFIKSGKEKNVFFSASDIHYSDDDKPKIIIKGSGKGKGKHNQTVWVQADGKDKKTIKVENINGKEKITVDGKEVTRDELEKMEDAKVISKKGNIYFNSSDDEDDNVFIIKSTDDKDDNEKIIIKKSNRFAFSSEKDKPLIVVDGNIVKFGSIDNMSTESIESISVLKGEKAIKKYGEKAKNGAIEITTKKKE
jgi:beta-lactamase regulating signal transducer with metallopeptidase domain